VVDERFDGEFLATLLSCSRPLMLLYWSTPSIQGLWSCCTWSPPSPRFLLVLVVLMWPEVSQCYKVQEKNFYVAHLLVSHYYIIYPIESLKPHFSCFIACLEIHVSPFEPRKISSKFSWCLCSVSKTQKEKCSPYETHLYMNLTFLPIFPSLCMKEANIFILPLRPQILKIVKLVKK
jgi:hypothetical protein